LETEQDLGSKRRIPRFLLFVMDLTQDELDYLKNYPLARNSPEPGLGKNDREREDQKNRITGRIHRSKNRQARTLDRSISLREVRP
jgi:hypothetical protein